MALSVTHSADAAQARAALEDHYVFVTELDVPPTDNALHWHSFNAQFLLTKGDLTLTDEHGRESVCGAGSVVTVPAQTLHREHSVNGYQIVLGTSVTPDEFGDPVNRPADTRP